MDPLSPASPGLGLSLRERRGLRFEIEVVTSNLDGKSPDTSPVSAVSAAAPSASVAILEEAAHSDAPTPTHREAAVNQPALEEASGHAPARRSMSLMDILRIRSARINTEIAEANIPSDPPVPCSATDKRDEVLMRQRQRQRQRQRHEKGALSGCEVLDCDAAEEVCDGALSGCDGLRWSASDKRQWRLRQRREAAAAEAATSCQWRLRQPREAAVAEAATSGSGGSVSDSDSIRGIAGSPNKKLVGGENLTDAEFADILNKAASILDIKM